MSRRWGFAKRSGLGYRILHRREVITDTGMGMGCSIYGGVLHFTFAPRAPGVIVLGWLDTFETRPGTRESHDKLFFSGLRQA